MKHSQRNEFWRSFKTKNKSNKNGHSIYDPNENLIYGCYVKGHLQYAYNLKKKLIWCWWPKIAYPFNMLPMSHITLNQVFHAACAALWCSLILLWYKALVSSFPNATADWKLFHQAKTCVPAVLSPMFKLCMYTWVSSQGLFDLQSLLPIIPPPPQIEGLTLT